MRLAGWLLQTGFSGGLRQQIQANSQPSRLKNYHLIGTQLSRNKASLLLQQICKALITGWKRHFMLSVTTVQLSSSKGFGWKSTEMHRLYLQHQLLSSIPYTATVKSKTRNKAQTQTEPGKIT